MEFRLSVFVCRSGFLAPCLFSTASLPHPPRPPQQQSQSSLHAPLSQMSGSWRQVVDPASGREYWCNDDTGESSWTMPEEAIGESTAAGGGSFLQQAAAIVGAEDTKEEMEPPEYCKTASGMFRQVVDPASGHSYWCNEATGESSWTLPEDPVEEPCAAAGTADAAGSSLLQHHVSSSSLSSSLSSHISRRRSSGLQKFEVRQFLESHGLEKYADIILEDVDCMADLRELRDTDEAAFKARGVKSGPFRRLLRAIRDEASSSSASSDCAKDEGGGVALGVLGAAAGGATAYTPSADLPEQDPAATMETVILGLQCATTAEEAKQILETVRLSKILTETTKLEFIKTATEVKRRHGDEVWSKEVAQLFRDCLLQLGDGAKQSNAAGGSTAGKKTPETSTNRPKLGESICGSGRLGGSISDRDALLTFLEATGGAKNSALEWDLDKPVELWDGIRSDDGGPGGTIRVWAIEPRNAKRLKGDITEVRWPAGLERLVLTWCKTITGDISRTMWPPGLKHIDFSICRNITADMSIPWLPKKLQTLRLINCSTTGRLSAVQWPEMLTTIELTGDTREGGAGKLSGDFTAVTWPRWLQKLKLSNCDITGDLEAFAWPEELEELDLSGDVRGDLARIRWPSTLQVLDLNSNCEGDLNAVKWPAGLTSLTLKTSRKVRGDISAMQFPAGLKKLYMTHMQITADISAVRWPPALRDLDIGCNGNVFGDIRKFRWPAKLEHLGLAHTKVSGNLGEVSVPETVTFLAVHLTQVTASKGCPVQDEEGDLFFNGDEACDALRRWIAGWKSA